MKFKQYIENKFENPKFATIEKVDEGLLLGLFKILLWPIKSVLGTVFDLIMTSLNANASEIMQFQGGDHARHAMYTNHTKNYVDKELKKRGAADSRFVKSVGSKSELNKAIKAMNNLQNNLIKSAILNKLEMDTKAGKEPFSEYIQTAKSKKILQEINKLLKYKEKYQDDIDFEVPMARKTGSEDNIARAIVLINNLDYVNQELAKSINDFDSEIVFSSGSSAKFKAKYN